MSHSVPLMCSQVKGHKWEVVMETFLRIGRIDEAQMNLFEAQGGGKEGNWC